jgi:hypothetical protein
MMHTKIFGVHHDAHQGYLMQTIVYTSTFGAVHLVYGMMHMSKMAKISGVQSQDTLNGLVCIGTTHQFKINHYFLKGV